MSIDYKINAPIATGQFIERLDSSSPGQRRPVEDRACMEGMIIKGNLADSAWEDERLVGIARSLTDFHF